MYQKVVIVGNLGSDPEMRYTQSGIAVTNFSVAVDDSYNNRDGDRVERTTWFRVNAWDKQAISCDKYLTKGQKVLVEGEMQAPSVWTDRQGEARASLELRARNVKFLNNRSEVEAMGGRRPDGSENRESSRGQSYDDDDDIPF